MDIAEIDVSLENMLALGFVIKVGDGYLITEAGIRYVKEIQDDMAQPKN